MIERSKRTEDKGQEIPLRDGGAFLVSEEDHARLSQWEWYLDEKGYPRALRGGRSRPAHNHVMGRYEGPKTERMEVDHINEVKTDNRRSNLQWLTPQEHRVKTARAIAEGITERYDRRAEWERRFERQAAREGRLRDGRYGDL
jgi:hypothetical protein